MKDSGLSSPRFERSESSKDPQLRLSGGLMNGNDDNGKLQNPSLAGDSDNSEHIRDDVAAGMMRIASTRQSDQIPPSAHGSVQKHSDIAGDGHIDGEDDDEQQPMHCASLFRRFSSSSLSSLSSPSFSGSPSSSARASPSPDRRRISRRFSLNLHFLLKKPCPDHDRHRHCLRERSMCDRNERHEDYRHRQHSIHHCSKAHLSNNGLLLDQSRPDYNEEKQMNNDRNGKVDEDNCSHIQLSRINSSPDHAKKDGSSQGRNGATGNEGNTRRHSLSQAFKANPLASSSRSMTQRHTSKAPQIRGEETLSRLGRTSTTTQSNPSMSPHAQHYIHQRARTKELRKKTFLPYYRSLMLGTILFPSASQVVLAH
ncbi:hypothetical protein KP509_09G097600 [Ceratopteris richardii]|nr:hypothetical protein KP509_09G097600 [Ceratopteris richardii]